MITKRVTRPKEMDIYQEIHRLSRNAVKNEHDACDLTQETFLQLEKGRKKWDSAQSKWAWAIGVFNRQLKRFWRLKQRNKREKTIPTQNKIYNPEEQAMQKEQLERMMKVIEELNESMAQALLLFTFEQMSIKKISQIQNAPEGTVKWRIFEARKIVESRLGFDRE